MILFLSTIYMKYFYKSHKYSEEEKYLIGSVSRLVPSGVQSSVGHISKTKLQINLELEFSYSRHRNAAIYYKI